jgi:dUTP pyrophosphatase
VVEARAGGVLSAGEIRWRLGDDPPLVRDYVSIDDQLQPNGFDLTLASVHRHVGRGTVGLNNTERVLANLEPLEFDIDGFVNLDPGIYHVTYNEIVALPLDAMALGRPRSSLNRNGVTIHSAVWDAGYEGRSTSLLHVVNPAGFRVRREARILQLVFITLNIAVESGYSGIYQGENVGPPADS